MRWLSFIFVVSFLLPTEKSRAGRLESIPSIPPSSRARHEDISCLIGARKASTTRDFEVASIRFATMLRAVSTASGLELPSPPGGILFSWDQRLPVCHRGRDCQNCQTALADSPRPPQTLRNARFQIPTRNAGLLMVQSHLTPPFTPSPSLPFTPLPRRPGPSSLFQLLFASWSPFA